MDTDARIVNAYVPIEKLKSGDRAEIMILCTYEGKNIAESNRSGRVGEELALSDELYGHTLAIVACGISEGKYCYYRGPHDGGAIMMAVSGVPEEVFEPVDMQCFISATMECIQQFEVEHKIFVESLLMWNGTSYEWSGNRIIAHFAQDLEIVFEQVGESVRISGIKTV